MWQSTNTKKGVAKKLLLFPSLNFSKVNFFQRRTAINDIIPYPSFREKWYNHFWYFATWYHPLMKGGVSVIQEFVYRVIIPIIVSVAGRLVYDWLHHNDD